MRLREIFPVRSVVIGCLIGFTVAMWLPEPCQAGEVVFDIETVKKMVVELEGCRISNEQLTITQGMIDSLNNQIAILEQKYDEADKTVKKYEVLVDQQKESYEAQLKDAKPSIFQDILKVAGGIGMGILIGIILIH